jgi:hypothetical protein
LCMKKLLFLLCCDIIKREIEVTARREVQWAFT